MFTKADFILAEKFHIPASISSDFIALEWINIQRHHFGVHFSHPILPSHFLNGPYF
ncbi:hypothetical protein I4U23_031475 [Adineta vaga]|nr:hypothetical protein I4U23_031475 [Adineta vaga]